MVSPDSSMILAQSPMQPALDIFTCGICKHIVQPFPMQCVKCQALYCEVCIHSLPSWQCQKQACASKHAPTDLHRSVREILQRLKFHCPGCKDSFPYDKVFEHASKCQFVPATSKYSA